MSTDGRIVRLPQVAEEVPLAAQAQPAYTLAARYYVDPAIAEREKEAIFYRNWHYLGHLSQLARSGDYLTLRIADESVFVVRGEDERLRGFYNVCRHRAHELLQGAGNTRAIVCPYHAWSYHLDGRLRHARNSERVADFDPAGLCLTPVRVETLCGLVFVNLDEAAAPLGEQMPGLEEDLRDKIPQLDRLRPVEAFDFAAHIEADWKVVVDNFVECYHCTPAHRDFVDLIDMSAYRLDDFGRWSRQYGPRTRQHNSAYPFGPDDVQHAAFWYLWPTTTINLIPGAPGLMVLSILPAGCHRSSFVGHRYALDDGPDEARSAYVRRVLGPEDQALCESVQRGLMSRAYNQGRVVVDPARSGISEHALHQFHRLVLEALQPG